MKVKQQIVMNGSPSAGLGAFDTFPMRWLPLFCTLANVLVALLTATWWLAPSLVPRFSPMDKSGAGTTHEPAYTNESMSNHSSPAGDDTSKTCPPPDSWTDWMRMGVYTIELANVFFRGKA